MIRPLLSFILLGAIVLGTAEPTPVSTPTPAAAQNQALAEAHRLQAARDPRAAIPLYTQVIERDPTDIAVSAPALSGLIACHQMLASDAAQAESYRVTVGRWLEHPPALDGTTVPAPAALREELLWAPMRSLVWQVSEINSGTSKTTDENGEVTRTHKNIVLAPRGGSLPMLDGAMTGSTLVVSVGAQRIQAPVTVLVFNQRIHLHVAWEDQPGVRKLDRIEGVVRLRQPLEVKHQEFPLVKGAELAFVDGKATVDDVERDGDLLEVVVGWKRTAAIGRAAQPDPNDAVTIHLKTPTGELLSPKSQGSGGGGGDGRMRYHRNLRFRCGDQVVGVVRTVTAWSYRDVPVLVEQVDLAKRSWP